MTAPLAPRLIRTLRESDWKQALDVCLSTGRTYAQVAMVAPTEYVTYVFYIADLDVAHDTYIRRVVRIVDGHSITQEQRVYYER
jgi:hypothetical protein